MSQTKSGNPSTKHPVYNMTWKRALKIERIARLSIDPANYTNAQIANFMGCTEQTIILIRRLPEYQAKMLALTTAVTSPWDADILADSENAREELKAQIPSAMMVIKNSLYSKNENLRFKAALEILDRDGTLGKVSKTSITLSEKAPTDVDKNTAGTLLALLGAAPINSNDASIITGEFTTNAATHRAQEQALAEKNTEELLDAFNNLNTTKPN
jgi:hypothetical protein